MAEWVGQLITGVTAVAGLGATLLVAKQTREHASSTAHETAAANLRQGLIGKRYDAYVRILQIGFTVQQWISNTNKALIEGGLDNPPGIDDASWAEINALAAAYSSNAISREFQTWADAVLECRKNALAVLLRYRTIAEHGGLSGKQPEDLYDAFKRSSILADNSYKLLANKINVELTKVD